MELDIYAADGHYLKEWIEKKRETRVYRWRFVLVKVFTINILPGRELNENIYIFFEHYVPDNI
jgi:hypothetical protein